MVSLYKLGVSREKVRKKRWYFDAFFVVEHEGSKIWDKSECIAVSLDTVPELIKA